MLEKRKIEIGSLEPGQLFKYGGLRWCKLDDMGNGALCCVETPLYWMKFGWDNDWFGSMIRKRLHGKLKNAIIKYGGNKADFLAFDSDLTAADGTDDYGVVEDTMALLSDDMYRKYRGILTPTDKPFWTLTPHSTTKGNTGLCHYVGVMGDIDKAYSNTHRIYIRPIALLENSTMGIVYTEQD